MAELIDLKTFHDDRGNLTVIEKLLPFDIKRIYYIYDVSDDKPRGGHRHIKTKQAAICLQWICRFSVDDGSKKQEFVLDQPNKCLILEPQDWHTMHFIGNVILLVVASEYFDPADYVADPLP